MLLFITLCEFLLLIHACDMCLALNCMGFSLLLSIFAGEKLNVMEWNALTGINVYPKFELKICISIQYNNNNI